MPTLLLHVFVTGLALALARPDPRTQADLCALLTEAEAEAIVGKPLAAPEPRPNGDCWYSERAGTGGGGDIMLHVFPHRFGSEEEFHAFLVKEVKAMDESMKKAMEKMGAPFEETALEPVPEVKAPAYYADPTLFMLKGGRMLGIAASRPHAVAVAAKALPRF